MKFIQSFISDTMSRNSLKSSINSEPESSLDSCIMKETSVDDCILSKEMNGDKELCLSEYDIKNVGNATKKMFEQVDLNSSITNSESPMKKDSWNSEALYDNTSEKENMGESNDMRYDILSDDDSGSIHLKISDDENSVGDAEVNEPSDTFNQQLEHITEEDLSQYPRDFEIGDDVENSHQSTSNTSREAWADSFTPEKDKKDMSQCSDETEAKSTLGVESGHEDSTEEFESMPSCSESQLSLSVCDGNVDAMVSEVKSKPSSSEMFSSKKDLDILEKSLEINNEENSSESDCTRSLKSLGKIFDCDDSSPKKLNAPFDCFAKKDSAKLHGISLSRSVDDESMGKDDIILSDDAMDSDSCMDNLDVNGLEICDEPQRSDEEGEESCNESIEEQIVGSKEVEEMEYEEKEISSESVEEDDTNNDKKLDESNEQIDLKSPEEILTKDCSNEEKFLEILEYQPPQEDGEDLREINSDKDVSSSEIVQKYQKDEHLVESLEPQMCDVESEKDNVASSELNELKESDDTSPQTVIEGYSIDSPETNSSVLAEESAQYDVNNIDKVLDSKVGNKCDEELQLMDSSDSEGKDNTVHGVEDDVKLVSDVPIGGKTDTLPESCEAQSGRKRSSSNEENLVTCSKRTKVAITESDSNDCDILVCEKTTDSDCKAKCTDLDTEEKSDAKSKRLSSSVSDEVEVKKIRVMPETPNSEKEEKTKKKITDENLTPLKSIEKTSDSKKDSDNSENLKLKSFLRYCTHEQLKTMTRSDLEEMIVAKICESIAERSQCGTLREKVLSLEEKLKNWQKKALQLTKQVKDLNLVLKRFGSDLQSKGPTALPVKITRSVGLQVQMPGSNNWHQEENSKRKGEKSTSSSSSTTSSSSSSSSSSSTPVSASQTSTTKTTASSPASKSTSSTPKASDGGDTPATKGADTQASSRQNNPQTTAQPILKVVPPKIPTSTSSGSTNANKPTSKTPPSSLNNRSKSSPELQVIDLTDAEEKSKTNNNQVAAVSSAPVTTTAPVPVTTTVASSVSAVTSMGLTNMSRSIRVVQHLASANTPILTQSGANAVAGQRVAYFVPSTSGPVQQRQLIISSPSQVRPAGVVTMSQRTNPLPTIVLKPGQVVPVSPVSATGSNIIRTSTINSSIQLTSPRGQPRPGQLLQRLPVNASSVQSTALSVVQSAGLSVSSVSHPAPLPPVPSVPSNPNWKCPPPKPDLKISKVPNRNQQGIVLSWNMTVTNEYEEIASYQLFAYQEGSAPPSTQLWKKVGDVKALPLPMACTLTQFMEGHKYHFAVRAVDIYARYGPFSAPGHIVLTRN